MYKSGKMVTRKVKKQTKPLKRTKAGVSLKPHRHSPQSPSIFRNSIMIFAQAIVSDSASW